MKIIEVIPISRGIGKETLSYFTAQDLKIGSLVTVPLRKKFVYGIVVSSASAREEKLSIRSLDFEIRKIDKVKSQRFFTEAFMKTVRESASYFASSTGALLSAVSPRTILNEESAGGNGAETGANNSENVAAPEKFVIQADDEERFANYKSLIREEFARRHSLFFCAPTVEDIKKVSSFLPKGIEEYSYIFHNGLPKNKIKSAWKAALHNPHPILIIATGSYMCLPREDIGTVVVENESSRAYKMPVRPFLDFRVFAEFFARGLKARLIFGDSLLRVETIWRYEEGEFVERLPLKFRFLSTNRSSLIDARQFKSPYGKPFRTLSPALEELIQETKKNNENLFIFVGRRGHSPLTVCRDCGEPVLCGKCGSQTVLHKAPVGYNFFFCHKCGERREAAERCAVCRSWRLEPLGIGIESVENEIKKTFPNLKLRRIDSDVAKTASKAGEIVKNFYASPGSVLIGTEMALSHLDRKIERSAVVSVDGLLSLPDFRISEQVMRLLLKIRGLATKSFLIQTRNVEESAILYALNGNLVEFYRNEIALRKKLRYPPFVTVIKISRSGDRQTAAREMSEVEKDCASYEPILFPTLTEGAKGVITINLIIKIPREKWVDKTLSRKLLSLPPQFQVEVDPESFL